LTREREIGDSLKKEDGFSETIAILRSQLEARDDAIQTAKSAFDDSLYNQLRAKDLEIQTAKSAFGSEIDTMRKREIQCIDEVKTLNMRLQAIDRCDICGHERTMLQKGRKKAEKQVEQLKLQMQATSVAHALREGHRTLIDQVVRIANTVEEDNLEPELSIDLQDPIPNLEVVALKATISKQKKRLVDLGSRLTAVLIKTQRTLASADKELRESRMEELYIQCVTDLAPVIIDLKQEIFVKDRTIQNLRSNIASSMSQSRNSQHLISRMNETSPFGQSRNVHQSASLGSKKDQAITANARNQEEATLRLMREKRFQTAGR
jgi:hypothetical protein